MFKTYYRPIDAGDKYNASLTHIKPFRINDRGTGRFKQEPVSENVVFSGMSENAVFSKNNRSHRKKRSCLACPPTYGHSTRIYIA